MSTLTLASASARKMRPAMPGWSGTPSSVIRVSAVEWVTAVTSGLLHRFLLGDDNGTGSVVEARPAVDPHAVVARVLDRAQLEHAGARRRHLEHLLEGDDRQLARVGDDARIGAEDARDVGVDLADLGAERRGHRDRRRVRAAAAERRHVVARRDALEARDEDDLAVVERGRDPVGADVEDPRLRVRGVGDDARPASRSARPPRGRGRGSPSRTARTRSARRSRAACPSRAASGTGETSSAIAISSSVVLPRAESTATTLLAGLALGDDPPRSALDPLRVGDRRPAELHHDDAHPRRRISAAPPAACACGAQRPTRRRDGRVAIQSRSGLAPRAHCSGGAPQTPKASEEAPDGVTPRGGRRTRGRA